MTTKSVFFGARRAHGAGLGAREPRVEGSKSVESDNLNLNQAVIRRMAVTIPLVRNSLLDSIDVTTQAGLRDHALISLMIYSFARVGVALAMKVEDVHVQNRRLWVRLHDKIFVIFPWRPTR